MLSVMERIRGGSMHLADWNPFFYKVFNAMENPSQDFWRALDKGATVFGQ